MAQPLPQHLLEEYELEEVAAAWTEAVNNLETEDDKPVDNLFSAKQQRLLTRALYSSWTPPAGEEQSDEKRKFLADANVGLFYSPYQPPLVPDFFLSLDVEPHQDWYVKEHRSYFTWEFEKTPDVVVEIVSNQKGEELGRKLQRYARIGITYYVVYDPQQLLSKDIVRVYEQGIGKRYRLRKDLQLPNVGLSLTLWHGTFEGHPDAWLRWCDSSGKLIQTGEERATQADARIASEVSARQEAEARAEQAEAELVKLREEVERLRKPAS
jgi:Uma2 family endonuclease